jgi:hypothetical protein
MEILMEYTRNKFQDLLSLVTAEITEPTVAIAPGAGAAKGPV